MRCANLRVRRLAVAALTLLPAAAILGMMAVLIGAVGVGVAWLSRRRGAGSAALEILERRYANGEHGRLGRRPVDPDGRLLGPGDRRRRPAGALLISAQHGSGRGATPLEILDRRLAAGEIGPEEYRVGRR